MRAFAADWIAPAAPGARLTYHRAMRGWLVVLGLVACDARDECTQIKDKARPVFQAMLRDAGKPPMPSLEHDLQEMCAEPTTDEARTFRACMLAAASQA